jgi:hypothetical protein
MVMTLTITNNDDTTNPYRQAGCATTKGLSVNTTYFMKEREGNIT